MYHVANEAGDFSLCLDLDLLTDELISQEEALRPDGRWFNCGACFEILHGKERRPRPPEEAE